MKTIYKPFNKVYIPSTKQKYAWLFLHDNSQIVYKIYHLQTDFFIKLLIFSWQLKFMVEIFNVFPTKKI